MAEAGHIRRMLADLIADASDAEVSAERAFAARHSLAALGLSSLALVRLIAAIEDTFGVHLDPDLPPSERVDTLAIRVAGLMAAGDDHGRSRYGRAPEQVLSVSGSPAWPRRASVRSGFTA
jgi:acyl carrier protein